MDYQNNILKVLEMVNLLKSYCEEYKEWPKNYGSPVTDKEMISKKLSTWIYYSKFLPDKSMFKYAYIKDQNGVFVDEIMSELYDNYKKVETANDRAIKMVYLVQNYCETFDEWPVAALYPGSKQDELSIKLYNWLYNSHYLRDKKQFKFAQVKLNNGKTIIEFLDELYEKYNYKMFEKFCYYCDACNKWPVKVENPSNYIDGLSNRLYRWLRSINYNIPNKDFRLNSMVDSSGINIKTILDTYYIIYGNLTKNNFLAINDTVLDTYYYLILDSVNCIYKFKNVSEIKAVFNFLNKINIDIYELKLNTITKEQLEFFWNKYVEYSLANDNDCALLFKYLYNYALIANNNVMMLKLKK